MKIRIRKATVDDIDEVVKIEEEFSVVNGRLGQYKAELSNPLCQFYVAVDPATDEIIGYTIFWIIDRLIEIHHVTVKSNRHRSGIGHYLMNIIDEKASLESVDQIFLEVRKSNQNAITFYRKLGFTECGFRKAYYRNPLDDALIFNKSLS